MFTPTAPVRQNTTDVGHETPHRLRRRRDVVALLSLPLIVAVVALAQISEGGTLRALVQPTAALVVFGGTVAAMLLSYPSELLRRTLRAVGSVFHVGVAPNTAMVHRFEVLAVQARRHGALSLEGEIPENDTSFLSRALQLVVDGIDPAYARRTLEAYNDARESADLECAEVLESAAGYAPTLGIVGTVMGLIQVLKQLSAPAAMGEGLAVAFVATLYGVGLANLFLIPLATRLRAHARSAAVTRELIVEAAVAIRTGVHPRLVSTQLEGYVRSGERPVGFWGD
jgi:chemotaxis protein MotA